MAVQVWEPSIIIITHQRIHEISAWPLERKCIIGLQPPPQYPYQQATVNCLEYQQQNDTSTHSEHHKAIVSTINQCHQAQCLRNMSVFQTCLTFVWHLPCNFTMDYIVSSDKCLTFHYHISHTLQAVICHLRSSCNNTGEKQDITDIHNNCTQSN